MGQEAAMCRASGKRSSNNRGNNNGHKEDKLLLSGKFIYVGRLIFPAGWLDEA